MAGARSEKMREIGDARYRNGVFAGGLLGGFDPEKEMKSSWPLSTQLMHCWRRYVERDSRGSLAKGRDAAMKAGVHLPTVVLTNMGDMRERGVRRPRQMGNGFYELVLPFFGLGEGF